LEALQEFFEMLVFGLGVQILGFKLSKFIFKLDDPSGMNKL